MHNLRVFVSLGGVNYGTELSDETVCKNPAFSNAPAACKQLHLMNKLSQYLKYLRWFERKSTYSNMLRASKVKADKNITWSFFLKRPEALL